MKPHSDTLPGGQDEKITNDLVPLLHILDAFNHRHKNQHRVARWWNQFSLLRRSTKRLHDALARRLRFRSAQNAGLKKLKSQHQKPSKARSALDLDIAASVHALLDTTIPTSFLAFTQLTADNQHAALGLVLLGVLASINNAVAPLVPGRPQNDAADVPAISSVAAPIATPLGGYKRPDIVDLGVAISRDELREAAASKTGRREEPINESRSPPKRKLASLPDDAVPPETKKSKQKSNKKKSRKGDEFSDLFSSLM
ncbi:hypothetical protein CMUS01_10678 [Colletotrichum musicola]|uniref:RNase MRP protein 1 RNA binding domain-containing protein n=1 Tax=Colletotrichum musicola TaxID=2175873 RepID=A0A8H6K2H8_9PEZI|nr:hypothetical protein CMUS01_10678 [Colletotrichum musicola]